VDRRTRLTISMPPDTLRGAREVTRDGESLNEFIVCALDREIQQRRAWAAHESILELRERVRARTGAHPDPVPLIRALRNADEWSD
jgi:hypothetical protein